MKILIVGGGGREHALAWKLAQSPAVDKMFAAPGNAGIAELAECVTISVADPAALADFAESKGIGLTVVGPEAPLVAGVADEFAARGLPLFGPSAAGARLEGSKAWAKEMMRKAGIPTAAGERFEDSAKALAYVEEIGAPCVVKADGLAAGKGVRVCEDLANAQEAVRDCLERGVFSEAGKAIVVEEFLDGEELSVMAVTDGRTVLPLAESQDHKRLEDGDLGPNTGGMGAYSPVPHLPIVETAVEQVFKPLVWALGDEGIAYRGVIYGGLIVTAAGLKVLEFNCRFGDPEAQVLLPRLDSDLAEMLLATVEGDLGRHTPRWSPKSCVCVVLAAGSYPEKGDRGTPISGVAEAARLPGVAVFHAGTARSDGRLVTAGGRVLGVSAFGDGFREARQRAYEAVDAISFDGMRFRRDIGWRGVK